MFRTTAHTVLLFTLTTALSACGSSDPEQNSGSNTAGKTTVGAQGGVIQLDNGFEITVPEGALTQDVSITVTELSETPAHSGFQSHGPSFLLGPEGQTFAKPLTLKLPYTGVALPQGMKLDVRAFTAPKGSDAFTQLTVTERGESVITTSTTHFSVFTAGMLTPATVSGGEKFPLAVAADADYVYWTNSGNNDNQRQDGNEGFVMRAPKAGGAGTPITAAMPDPRAIALDDTHIYWVNGGDSDGGGDNTGIPGSVMRANKDGSDTVELSSAGFPVSILLSDGYLYWGDAGTNEIRRLPVAGGASELVTDAAYRPEFIIADATDIYWTGGTEGNVSRAPKTGGTAIELASGQTDAKGIVLVGDNVYWADAGSSVGAGGAADIAGAIRMVPKAGGSVTDVYTSAMPTDLKVVGDDLVFTDQVLGMVVRLPVAGGEATVLSMDQSLPWRLYFDGTDLLWSNAGKYEYDGSIQHFSL
ncbi:MAG: hypothetical protein AB7S68_26865 [Polyangiaceae bacterium]